MQTSLNVEKLKSLGEIKITVYRGAKVKLGNEYPIPDLNVVEQVPERLMKGKLLKNNVRNVQRL